MPAGLGSANTARSSGGGSVSRMISLIHELITSGLPGTRRTEKNREVRACAKQARDSPGFQAAKARIAACSYMEPTASGGVQARATCNTASGRI